MRVPRILIGGGLLALIALPLAVRSQPQGAEAERKAIQKVLDDQVLAWNKGDLETFMLSYAKSDDLTFFSGKDKRLGWKDTLKRYQDRYQAPGKDMGKTTFSDIQIEILGPDAAYVRGRYQVVMKKETFEGLFTLILRKMADGWKIVHDHTSVG